MAAITDSLIIVADRRRSLNLIGLASTLGLQIRTPVTLDRAREYLTGKPSVNVMYDDIEDILRSVTSRAGLAYTITNQST